MEYKDYYKTLGVSKDASPDDIKKAYRKLAMKYHPDKNPGVKAAEARFREINEANEVLHDPEKRKKYDQFGQNYQQYQSGAGPGGGGFTRSGFGQQGRGSGQRFGTSFDFDNLFNNTESGDFFEMLFGERYSGQSGRSRARSGEDVVADATISLEEAFEGTSRMVQLNGETIKVTIKPGTADGQRLRVPGRGEVGQRGGAAGDLIINITVSPHPVFERKENDVHCTIPIDLLTMILGGKAKIRTLKGIVDLKIPAESQNGQMMKLASMGMPVFGKRNEYGDLYVKLDTQLPKQLRPAERELFEKLRELGKPERR
jgi:curved DNA-binding protein